MLKIAFMSQKGGCGKTTLSVHTAVAAQESGAEVMLFDTDVLLKSATKWSVRRGEDKPVPVTTTPAWDIPRLLGVAEETGYTLAVVDTAPHADPDAPKIASAVDLIVVPCRPTIFDLEAVENIVEIASKARKRVVFVLSACPDRAPEIEETEEILAEHFNYPIWSRHITERRGYFRALPSGRAVTEFDSKGKAADEVRELWSWLQEQTQ
jgi:chromosome partitioning protein